MKKLVVSLAMFLSVFSIAVANEGTNSPNNFRVEASFQKECSGAKSVKWELIRKENIYQAHFIYNNERLNAYFDEDGVLIATGRFVAVANLPLLVRKNVYQKYSDYQVKEVVEFVTNDETSYLVSLE